MFRNGTNGVKNCLNVKRSAAYGLITDLCKCGVGKYILEMGLKRKGEVVHDKKSEILLSSSIGMHSIRIHFVSHI
jgi:hypothetical protein